MQYSFNQNKKINPKLWILALLSLYGVWQLGVMFFSGTSLSLYGKTPININASYTTYFIVGGYLTKILFNYFFFRKSLLMGKIVLTISLLITILMFIPIGTTYLTILFYINALFCSFLIGTNYAVETNLLDNKSELKFVFLCSLITFLSIVLMQGDFLHIPFIVFNIISIILLVSLIVVYIFLPKNIKTYQNKDNNDNKHTPILLKIGVYFAIFVSTLCLVFGTAISETITYGTGIFYFVGIVFTILFGWLVFKKNYHLLKFIHFHLAQQLLVLCSQFFHYNLVGVYILQLY